MVYENLGGETFFVHKLLLETCGMWPSNELKPGSLIILAIYSSFKLVTGPIFVILGNWDFLEEFQRIVIVIKTLSTLAVVWSIRLWSRRRVVRLIQSTIDDQSSITNPKERLIVKRLNSMGTYYFAVAFLREHVAWINYLNCLFFRVGRLSDGVTARSIITDVLELVLDTFANTGYFGIKILHWSLSMHLAGQFKILKINCQKFLRIKTEQKRSKEFGRLVERHNELLSLCRDLEDSFCLFVGIDILNSHFSLYWNAWELFNAYYIGDIVKVAKMAFLIGSSLLSEFVTCYTGEYLTTCSEEIGDVFRQCKWYNFSKNWRINFSIVLLQCRRPAKLTIVKLYKLNLATYARLVEFVYSFISLIPSINARLDRRAIEEVQELMSAM